MLRIQAHKKNRRNPTDEFDQLGELNLQTPAGRRRLNIDEEVTMHVIIRIDARYG
jgi:hypothetical protein